MISFLKVFNVNYMLVKDLPERQEAFLAHTDMW